VLKLGYAHFDIRIYALKVHERCRQEISGDRRRHSQSDGSLQIRVLIFQHSRGVGYRSEDLPRVAQKLISILCEIDASAVPLDELYAGFSFERLH
jgi:hypothetical protein